MLHPPRHSIHLIKSLTKAGAGNFKCFNGILIAAGGQWQFYGTPIFFNDYKMGRLMDFYRYLASSALTQMIALKDEAPPAYIAGQINYNNFTGSAANGREGFFLVQ